VQLLLRNARLLDRDGPVSLWCDGGLVAGVGADGDAPAGPFERTVDVDGRLLLPGLVDPHLHPDKSLLGDRLARSGSTLEEAVRFTWEFKRDGSVEEIAERSTRAVLESFAGGSTHLRAFADVDRIGGLKPVRGLLEMRERLRGLIDVQVVAFPQEALLRPDGDVDLLREAIELGADVVGGIPWFERSDEHARRHVDLVLDVAEEYDRDVHVLASAAGRAASPPATAAPSPPTTTRTRPA
jgi:cytosine deaminase